LFWLILTRHAESRKNLRDEHGGKGDTLTPRGRRQLRTIAKNIMEVVDEFSIPLSRLYYSDIVQVSETATYLSAKLKLPALADSRIAPLDLGMLGGLSRRQARETDPLAAERMEKWRRGDLDILELNLPGGESVNHFWLRGNKFLKEVVANQSSAVVVSSRSALIMLLNMLLGRRPTIPGDYHAWIFANVSLAAFSHNDRWTLRRSRGVTTADGIMLRG
jgi:broad specificity phosphatase PhoE